MQPANSDAKSFDTASEEWRRECEARWVLKLPTLNARREYLSKVEQRRGKPATEQLKRDMMREHKKKQDGDKKSTSDGEHALLHQSQTASVQTGRRVHQD